jgi:uncharacterized protein with HEPN domain
MWRQPVWFPSLQTPDGARLAIEAARAEIARIRAWAGAFDLEELRSDQMRLYAIERAFIALAEALRDIPDDIAALSGLEIRPAIGFRNMLAHSYGDRLDARVIATIREDLPLLDATLTTLAARIQEGC